MTWGHSCTSHATNYLSLSNKAGMKAALRYNTARSHKCGTDCYGIITCDVELLI